MSATLTETLHRLRMEVIEQLRRVSLQQLILFEDRHCERQIEGLMIGQEALQRQERLRQELNLKHNQLLEEHKTRLERELNTLFAAAGHMATGPALPVATKSSESTTLLGRQE